MTLAVGSIVTLSLSSADLPENVQGPDVNPQPPVYGVVTEDAGGGAAWDVLWEQGNRTLAVPSAALQDLVAVSAGERTRLWGRIAEIVGESGEYRGEVVAMYRRGDSPATERALLAMLTTGTLREVPTLQLAAVAGR